jgi:hypothetical protein
MRRTKKPHARRNVWTEEDIARIAINPYYALTISPNFLNTAPEITVPEGEWVALNAAACRAAGAKLYLENLADILAGDFAPYNTPGGDFFDPRCAIQVAEAFIVPAPAFLVTKKQWIDANSNLMGEFGLERWLFLFLDVMSNG